MIQVRRLHPDEWPLWKALRLEALAEAPNAFGATMDETRQRGDDEWRAFIAMHDGCGGVFMAEHEGIRVGMARVLRSPSDPPSCGLYGMWVAPHARRKGVGRALMEAAFAWALEAGVDEMALSVTLGNENAKRLYRAVGFVETGVREPLRPGFDLEEEGMVNRTFRSNRGVPRGDRPG